MLYWLFRALFAIMFATVYRWEITGREHVPGEGPFIVCANHLSWLDPPLVGSVIPQKVFFMAKEELFQYPVLGALLPRVGAFPVRRGRADRQALRRAEQLLKQGKVVGMFVEGTRKRDIEGSSARPGAAWLAVRNQVPIVPLLIEGPYRPWHPIRVKIGPAFELAEYYDQRTGAGELEHAGQKIMDSIITMRMVSTAAKG